jgi:hypothetical protein
MPAWVQPSWPQVQTISILSAIPSQWALQYFSLFGAGQVQAGLAHFLGVLAISLSLNARECSGHSRIRCRIHRKGCRPELLDIPPARQPEAASR